MRSSTIKRHEEKYEALSSCNVYVFNGHGTKKREKPGGVRQ